MNNNALDASPRPAGNFIRRAVKKITAQPPLTRYLWIFALWEFGYLIAQSLDTSVFTSLRVLASGSGRTVLETLKSAGYWPLWLLPALLLSLYDWHQSAKRDLRDICRRGVFLALCSGAAMLLAEILKMFVRRERPQAWLDVLPVFRDWSGAWWQTNDLGMPSSHAATAFGAALALALLFPAGRIIWWALALGCALSRVIDQAHTLTDIYAGAGVAWVVVMLLKRKFALNKEKTPC